MELLRFDIEEVGPNLFALATVLVLTLPVAWDRERSERRLGMRTFPLVAIASCGFMLIGKNIVGSTPDAQARILQGLITGVGFLGGGAIVKQGLNVHGTATAAAIWTTAALGVAVAQGLYEIAVTLSLIMFITLRWMKPLTRLLGREHEQAAAVDDEEEEQRSSRERRDTRQPRAREPGT